MVVWSGSGLMRPTFNNAAGLVTSQAPLPSLAHCVMCLCSTTWSVSELNGHGRPLCWLDGVAFDPIRTSEAKNAASRNESDSELFSRCISNKQIAGSRCVKGTSLSHNSRTDVMQAWANTA